MKTTLHFSICSLLMIVLSAGYAAAATKISSRAQAAIMKEIRQFGDTTVIVELSYPQMRLSQDSSIEGDEMLKTEVRKVQNMLLESLSAEDQETVIHSFEYVPGVAMHVDEEALARLNENEFVVAVYENGINKPSLAESTQVVFPGQATSEYNGNNEWTVAVLDTGVDKFHDFLHTGSTPKVVSEACYSRGGFGTNYPEIDSLCPGEGFSSTGVNSGLHCVGYEGCDHGTHVAGIAAGDGGSFDGVASKGKLIAVQVFTGIQDFFRINVCGTGVGDSCIAAFDVDILRGLERVYALRNTYNISSVNMSLGGGSYSSTCDGKNSLVTTIIGNLKSAGIATVVASGNDGNSSSISFPACISNAIAVGATFDAGGSKDMPTSYGNESSQLDLYAPGSFIGSSVPGGGFAIFQGTSMAAPHVAGAFAVLRHAKPDATVDEILELLKQVGPNVRTRNTVWQYRRLDVAATLSLLAPVGSSSLVPVHSLLLD